MNRLVSLLLLLHVAMPAPAAVAARDLVWIDDSFPPGAIVSSTPGAAPTRWIVANDRNPVASGNRALLRTATGIAQDSFANCDDPLEVSAGDRFFAYLRVDPANPPRAVALALRTAVKDHFAVWGDEKGVNWAGRRGFSQQLLGPLPSSGEWRRLEFAPEEIGLKPGAVILGAELAQHGGTVSWDRIGLRTRTVEPAESEWVEKVVMEDDFPSGAAIKATKNPMTWVKAEAGPVHSGTRSLKRAAAGAETDNFEKLPAFDVRRGDRFFVHVFIDPKDVTRELRIAFYAGGFGYRAVWTPEFDPQLADYSTGDRRLMGSLPAPGKWVRLEIPLQKVWLHKGAKITGLYLGQTDGTVYWDKLGFLTHATSRSQPPGPTSPSTSPSTTLPGKGATVPTGRILFAYKIGEMRHHDLWLVNPDGTGLTNLTQTPTADETNARISPGGDRIAYFATQTGKPTTDGIYVMNLNGTGRRQLVRASDYHTNRLSKVLWTGPGTLGFSGKSTKEKGTQFDFYTLDAATAVVRKEFQLAEALKCGDAFMEDVSRDRSHFLAIGSAGRWTPGRNVLSLRPDGSGVQFIHDDTGDNNYTDANPRWSPAGDWVGWSRSLTRGANQKTNYMGVAVSRADGSGFRVLTGTNEFCLFQSWSPDGSHILLAKLDHWGWPNEYGYSDPRGDLLWLNPVTGTRTKIISLPGTLPSAYRSIATCIPPRP